MNSLPSETRNPDEAGWQLAAFVLGYRWLAITASVAVATLVVAVTLAGGRTYTGRASFSPQDQDGGLGAYAGVAAQLGVTLPNLNEGQPPEFYAYMLRSDAILRSLADRRYVVSAGSTDSLPLAVLLNVADPNAARESYALLRELRNIIQVRYDARAQLVQIEVKTRYPGVSSELVVELLAQVDRFNREVLRTQAGEERRFTESRVAETAGRLRAAEDVLSAFLARNREIRNSPVLLAEQARLEREVQAEQSLYLTLRQSYEQARLQEVRNTPIISVIEAPVYPAIPDRRRLLIKALLGMAIGGMLGLAIGLLRNIFLRAVAEDPTLAGEAAGQLAAFGRELRSPSRVLRELRRELGRRAPPVD